ncbi:NAD(P)/FAD-dependent oxidoreductase [Amycolatopsis magusensis]|uniref:NADH dehydrogenase FAD-containing subunit n=1 Tax=Amycolatopsis magusensis TaxID=882444 RepID=A0ABS4Q7C8_9PSEU|nr:FAD-dependent oxidoreductase [Amycolatopsis magusensis]MBP2186998.1 NADH dehydrogenase FAD-containing subunit [Amycolatopsis magusensis]
MAGQTAVVVIGGGYAGVMAANRLTRRDDVTVTLINPRPTFVERIRLHQLAGGSDDAVVDYRDVLGDRVELVVDTVTRIDANERGVTLKTGGTLAYDYLIYAVGSGSADPRVPGAAEFAYPIGSLEEAKRLRDALDGTPAVTVAGGGLTGIETAAELAEQGRAVTLLCGGVLAPSLHASGRRSVAARLAKLGVTVLDGPGSTVTAVTRDTVHLGDGRELPSEVTVWTAGFGVPDLATRSGLDTDALGRLRTDETLTSMDDPRIVATGDAAAPSDRPFRMSCQAAVQLGPQAAETVLSRIAGEEPGPVHIGFAAQCVSLGRRAGVFQLTERDDTAKRHHLRGRAGAMIKELICKGIVWQLAREARKPGGHTLRAKAPKRRQISRTESQPA